MKRSLKQTAKRKEKEERMVRIRAKIFRLSLQIIIRRDECAVHAVVY